MAKKKIVDITADTTQAKATIGELEEFTKKSLKESAKVVDKSSKDISDAYKKMGIRTDASIKASTKAAKANYAAIKNSGTASAREIRKAHDVMTAKVKANNREISGGAGRLSKVFGALKGKMTAISIAIVAAGFAIKKAFDFAEAGAKLQVQRKAFDNFAKAMGADGDDIIAKLKEISKGTVSTADLVASAGKALLLGLDPSKLVGLLEIARAASKITGESIAKQFEDIATGTGRASKLILDNLGIQFSAGEAAKRTAEALGTSVDKLTDVEIRLGNLNEVVRAGQVIIQNVGEDYDSTSDKIARMKVVFAELIDKMEVFAADVFVKIEPSLLVMGKGFAIAGKGILKVIDFLTASFNTFKLSALGVSQIVLFFAKGFTQLSDMLGITNDATSTLNLMMEDLNKQMENTSDSIAKSTRKMLGMEEAEEKLGRETERTAAKMKKATDDVVKSKKQLAEEAKEAAKAIDKASKTQIEALKTQTTQQKILNATIKTALQATRQELNKLEQDLEDAVAFTLSIKQILERSDIAIAQQGLNPVEKITDDLNRAAVDMGQVQGLLKQGSIASVAAAKQITTSSAQAVAKFKQANTQFSKTQFQQQGFSTQGLGKQTALAQQLGTLITQATTQIQKMAQQAIPPVAAKLGNLQSQLTTGQNTLTGIKNAIDAEIVNAQKLKDLLNQDTTATHTQIIRTVQAQAEGGPVQPIKAKTGRHFPGYGGGDKIPILGEAGEYMLRKEAVRDLGLQAAKAFNNRDIPALLASLTAPVQQRLAEGGPVKEQGSSDTVNVNLLMGKKSFPMTSSRDTASDFVKNIRNLNIVHSRRKGPY